MAKQKIKCVSYVRVGEELVESSRLTPDQKKRLGTWLTVTFMNNMYSGRAEFRPASDDIPGSTNIECQ